MPSSRRYLASAIEALALKRSKLAFVAGPRQVGKTTLAKHFLSEEPGAYYNWDEIEFRRIWAKSPRELVEAPLRHDAHPLLVFDEIHKAKKWKTTLKGLYDRHAEDARFIVTGSARLNFYKKGGDSMMGRYLLFRLHPLSLGELAGAPPLSPDDALKGIFSGEPRRNTETFDATETWKTLRRFGGFPEPFFAQSEQAARLWRRGRLEKLVREDLRDLSRLPELSQLELLAALLPERAGGTLSIPSLREDLEVSYDTVKRWLGYLSELFYFFEIKPYARSIPRALKKEGKLYLWDWSEAPGEGARFENMVASHLLKACHYWTDTGEGTFELTYLRDKQKREIDFLLLRDRKPWLAIEAKSSDTEWSPHFGSFQKYLGNIPCLQLVDRPDLHLPPRKLPYRNLVVGATPALSWLP